MTSMTNVLILIGPSGCGKSRFASNYEPTRGWKTIVSADQYFMKHDKYEFDASLLGNAHSLCLRQFVNSIAYTEDHTIIVDNTNTTLVEIAPYYALAKAYGAEVEFVLFDAAPVICAARNTHGVPIEAIQAACERIARLEFPSYWQFSTLCVRLNGSVEVCT